MPVELTSTNPKPREFRLTGWMVFGMMAGFFGIIFIANAIMIWLAFDSWTGLETASSYEAGRQYQSEFDAAQRQNQRGWKVTANAVRATAGAASVDVELKDKAGAPLSGLVLNAWLNRPTNSANDRKTVLAEGSTGTYTGIIQEIAAGQWTLIIEARDAGKVVFRSRNRLVITN